MVLGTSQAEEYQLTCVAVKEGEDVQETLWDTVDFFIINWNNTCFSKNLFTQFETIVVYAKLFLIKLFTPNRTKGVFCHPSCFALSWTV